MLQIANCFSKLLFLLIPSVFVGMLLFLPIKAQSDLDDQVLDSIKTRLESGTAEQKRDALFEIKNLRNESGSKLAVTSLNDKDEMVRATAATAVVFMNASEAAAFLLPLLNDRKPFVRREAAFALGVVGNNSALNPLVRSIDKDKDDEVKVAAVRAIGLLGDVEAIPSLLKILGKKGNEDNEFIRSSAARSIGLIAQRIRGGRMQNIPQDFLPAKFKLNILTTPPASEISVRFLPAISDLKKVLQNFKESDDVRRNAAFALGTIADRSSEQLLISLLNDPDPFLSEISREAILKIDSSKNHRIN